MESNDVTYINQFLFYFQIVAEGDDGPGGIKGIKETFDEKVKIPGRVRLDAEGTKLFRTDIQNDPNKINEFFEKLTLELANAIPISPERVTTSKKFQIDTSVDPEQIILSID